MNTPLDPRPDELVRKRTSCLATWRFIDYSGGEDDEQLLSFMCDMQDNHLGYHQMTIEDGIKKLHVLWTEVNK